MLAILLLRHRQGCMRCRRGWAAEGWQVGPVQLGGQPVHAGGIAVQQGAQQAAAGCCLQVCQLLLQRLNILQWGGGPRGGRSGPYLAW